MTKTKSLTFITIIGVLLLISVEVLSKFYHLFEEGLLIRIEIGLLALVILLVMNLVFHFSSIQAESIVEQVRAFEREYINSHEARIFLLTGSEMYNRIFQSSSIANNRIYTCYFHTHPPADSPKEKKDYFNNILQLEKKKISVLVRRIVLFSNFNFPWIRQLVELHNNFPNYSLSIFYIKRDDIKPLSVQLYDNSEIFLMYPITLQPGKQRDILIQSPPQLMIDLFSSYYQELWDSSDIIIDMGKINSHNYKKMINKHDQSESNK